MTLAEEWLADLRATLTGEPCVDDARVGVFYTAVRVAGEVGVAFTPRDLSDSVCCPKAASGAPPAGRLAGLPAWEMAAWATSPHPLRRALGVATLNALSATALTRRGLPEGVLREGLDALAAAAFAPDDRVAMVGTFVPFLKRLKGRVADLSVIDRHPGALKPAERPLWVPPEGAAQAVSGASVLILTGSALVEGGLDELLACSGAARLRMMAGPTTPLWPRPFFRHGIGLLGGIRVTDAARLLTIAGEGGSGYLFEQAARKACVLDPAAVPTARRRPAS